ncbi:MAG: hypothetical protein PW735_05555 [Acidobacteriaceae bacterium]|nr:hypothetical protein [Acidobacteriaceae bacterium]
MRGPRLVARNESLSATRTTGRAELLSIAARRCSSFFAEAAVLVLVFGLLDVLVQKGHVALSWMAGAGMISLALLACSVLMDFGVHRWVRGLP